mgnify:CR=1 FL=1
MSKVNDLFQKKLHIVNFGIESFYEDLKSQKQEAIHVTGNLSRAETRRWRRCSVCSSNLGIRNAS